MEFEDLLQQAEQLNADIDSASELPRVECTFPQLVEKGQRLWSRTVGSSAAPQIGDSSGGAPSPGETTSSDVRASMLLGSKGVSVPKTAQRLEALRTTTRSLEFLEPVADTDIHGFLKNERENAILSVIEETKKNSFAMVDKLHWETMFNDWEVEKQKILQSLLGDSGAGDTLLLDVEPECSILDATSGGGGGATSRSSLDAVEILFAKQVSAYNDAVVQGGVRPNLMDNIVDTVEKHFGNEQRGLVELWSLMKDVTSMQAPVGSADVLVARCDHSYEVALISAGKRHLETNFKKFINTTVDAHLPQAKRGGVPGIIPLVKAFLNVRFAGGNLPAGLEDGLVEGQPVWPFIYYCIRCGDLTAALTVASASSALGDFVLCMKEFASASSPEALAALSPSTASKLMLTYRRSVRSSHDPFKRIVYCIIGGCDPADNHPEVATSIDDYLWLRLSLISVSSSSSTDISSESVTLRQIQLQLTEEYGESHFHAEEQPLRYAQVLLLTGQYEAATAFLSRAASGQLRPHAIHFALAVHSLGLLALPSDPIQAPLSSAEVGDVSPMKRLNLARLLTLYTKKFEATDPKEAIQYFYFMKDMKTSQGSNLFLTCLSELVLETREFDLLLGRVDVNDGIRRSGVIDKFYGDIQNILNSVAKDAEERGQLEDAVKLFDLAGDQEKVLAIFNKLLSQVVSQPGAPGSTRDRLVSTATNVASRYKRNGLTGSRTTTSTFHLLLDLATFFAEYHGGNFRAAIGVLEQLKILPFTLDQVEEKINAFKSFTEEMRRNLPDILLVYALCLHQSYKLVKSGAQAAVTAGVVGRGEDGGKEAVVNELRTRAKAMITFAGMLPYRLPGDTSARLVQLEVLMN